MRKLCSLVKVVSVRQRTATLKQDLFADIFRYQRNPLWNNIVLIHKNIMYRAFMHSPELLRGTLQIIILKVLKDHGKMYGYEITQRVMELSEGRISLTEGALYPSLHKLEAEGLLKTEVVNIGKRVRKYYTLTVEGKATAKEKVNEFLDFIRTMSSVLQIQLS